MTPLGQADSTEGLFHRGVAVVLRKAGRVLLVQRSPDREWAPGAWDLPSGHIEGDEPEPQAAEREALEELGVVLELSPCSPLGRLEGDDFEITYFVADSWSGEPQNAAPGEHACVAWFSAEELGNLLLAGRKVLPLVRRALS